MANELNTPLIIDDVYYMHIRHTQVRHRRYPELSGEGPSTTDAVGHLMDKLVRGLDSVEGVDRREFEQAVADVNAYRSTRAPRHSAAFAAYS
jgi:hypothetical protein